MDIAGRLGDTDLADVSLPCLQQHPSPAHISSYSHFNWYKLDKLTKRSKIYRVQNAAEHTNIIMSHAVTCVY